MVPDEDGDIFYDAIEHLSGDFDERGGLLEPDYEPCCSYDSWQLPSEGHNGNGGWPPPEASLGSEYPLHMAAFEEDVPRLTVLIQTASMEEKAKLDVQGNSILHIAVVRENADIINVILDNGFPSKVRNSKGWTALDEAISMRSHKLVSLLHTHGIKELKTEMKQAKTQLLKTLGELPDYSLELNWQLGSPVLGMILRKFAPHDTYKIWKRGSRIRVDGTLMGIEKQSTGLLPEWKRGKFSLLFNGSTTPAQVYLVLHEKQNYLDLSEEKATRKKAGQFDLDADVIIADGAGRTKLRAVDFRFKPVKGWLTGELTEKIEGWSTKVYEASGKMFAVTHLKSDWQIPSGASFEDYLKMEVLDDTIVEMPVNLSNMGGKASGGDTDDVDAAKKAGKPRKLTGRCWMAENFPMSLRQLLPLLDVVGHANKHLAKVAKFMHKYGDMNMFPVKIQIPLLLTVYLLVSFKKFKFTSPQDPTSFEVPDGFEKISLDTLLAASASKNETERGGSQDGDFEMHDADLIDF